MASPVQVKHEPGSGSGDVFNAATDSEAEDIDDDNLQTLAPKFASISKFPVGCKVWYNLRRSPDTIKAMSAYVVEVSIHVENGRRVYKVKSETSYEHKTSLYEDQLVYAISCPVTVTKVDSNESLDGIVVYLERQKGSDGKQQVTYAVQYLSDNHVTIEPGITADRIRYRVEDRGIGDGGKENKMSIEQQTTDNEGKGVEDLSHSLSFTESFDPVDDYEGNDLNRPNSLETSRWEAPSSLERKRSSGSKSNANLRPTKLAKKEVRGDVMGEVKRDSSKGDLENTPAVRVLTIPSWWVNQWGEENRRLLTCKSLLSQKTYSRPNCTLSYFHCSSSDE